MREYGWMVELLICGHSSAPIQANHVNDNQLHLVCVRTYISGRNASSNHWSFVFIGGDYSNRIVYNEWLLLIHLVHYWYWKGSLSISRPKQHYFGSLRAQIILDLLQLCWRCLERKGKRAWWGKEGVKFDGGIIICFALMRVKEWPHSKHRHTLNPYTHKNKCLHTSCLIKSSGSELFRANMANAIHQNRSKDWGL